MAWASELARRLLSAHRSRPTRRCPQCRGEVAGVSAAVSDAGEAFENHVARIGELAYHSLDGCG